MNTMRRQRGMTLVEVLAALAIASALLVGLSTMIGDSIDEVKEQQAALQQAQVVAAASRYLAANYSGLVTSTNGGTVTAVTVAQLKTAGFLPAGHIRTKLKFPILVAIKIWALAHLLANGESYSVVLFVTILAWAVILRITLKRRIASGETKLPVFVSEKYDVIAIVVGLVLYVAIVFKLHEWIIGVAPLP